MILSPKFSFFFWILFGSVRIVRVLSIYYLKDLKIETNLKLVIISFIEFTLNVEIVYFSVVDRFLNFPFFSSRPWDWKQTDNQFKIKVLTLKINRYLILLIINFCTSIPFECSYVSYVEKFDHFQVTWFTWWAPGVIFIYSSLFIQTSNGTLP